MRTLAVPSRRGCGVPKATVVDRSSVIVTHLAEVVRRNAGRLLGRQDVQMLVEGLRYDHPILAKDIDNDIVPMSTLHAVLQALLEDGVSIRHLGRIVEGIGNSPSDRTVDQLIAQARVSLAPAIAANVAPNGKLSVISLDPALEASFHEALREVDGDMRLVLDPERTERVRSEVQSLIAGGDLGVPKALVVGMTVRRPLQRLLTALNVDVPVLAYPELPSHLELSTVGVVGSGEVTAGAVAAATGGDEQ